MEQSAFEAVMIGVNVFVFIIALTAGILLMTNILDMADFANQNVVTGMNGALAEVVGQVEERVYSGGQILTYYRRIKEAEDAGTELKYDFKIKIASTEDTLKSYIETESLNNYIDSYFELSYKGVANNKETYVFVKKD